MEWAQLRQSYHFATDINRMLLQLGMDILPDDCNVCVQFGHSHVPFANVVEAVKFPGCTLPDWTLNNRTVTDRL